ncbi:MAG: HAD family hydrolase [Candidatus Thorarchaeota archaeon]
MPIKVIIFDLGGVIIELDYSNFYNKIITLSPSENPRTRTMLEFFRQSDLYHQGKMSDEDFYQLACNLLQVCKLNQSEFYNAFNSIVSHPIPEAIDLLKKLKEVNEYQLIAMSNVNASHWDYILRKNWDFLDNFDELILSHEVKITKPDPKIFKYAIKKAKCKPEEIVFVDDGSNNVRSAKKLGIIGIHFINIEKLIKDFEKLNIKFN